jgi:hypothetical protein
MRTAPWRLAIVIIGSMIYLPAAATLMLFTALGRCGLGPDAPAGCGDQALSRTIIVGAVMAILYAYLLWRLLRTNGSR